MSLRSLTKATLTVEMDGIRIKDEGSDIKLKFSEIKKFGGDINFFLHRRKSLHFTIKMNDNTKYELRVSHDIYNALTDMFPEKL